MHETTTRKALAGLAVIPGWMPREDSPITRFRRGRSCPGEDRGGASGTLRIGVRGGGGVKEDH